METGLKRSKAKRSRLGVPLGLLEPARDTPEEPSILELVTGPEFSTVGKPSASGTCRSVYQTLMEVDPDAPFPSAKICLQSAGGVETPVYRQAERFISMAEVG